jgi:hypothetical protein
MIEFYNEPDKSLSGCLTADLYKEYYLVRSLSIRHAYADLNKEDPENAVPANVCAAGFARSGYGGDPSRYLGDVSVQNNKVIVKLTKNLFQFSTLV